VGTVDVLVTTVGGTSAAIRADQFTYRPVPSVTSVAPNDGPAAGGTTVTITGSGYEGSSTVKFGPTQATMVTVNSATSITAVSPKGSGGLVDVTVSTGGGTSATGPSDQFAYLEAPEYGTCVKVAAGTGSYENSGCTKPGGTKAYEWYPAFGGPKPLAKTAFTTKIKETTTTSLETVTKTKVLCKGQIGTGAYISSKGVGNVQLTFTSCEGPGGLCTTTGGAPGEITTQLLTGTLGVTVLSKEGPLKNKIGSDLRPLGGLIAEFSCGATAEQLRGTVIGEVKANSMAEKATVKYVQKAGVQKPTHFVGQPNETLEASFGGGPFEQTGLALTTVQTNQQKVEINSVV
jgi:hypothetical protein